MSTAAGQVINSMNSSEISGLQKIKYFVQELTGIQLVSTKGRLETAAHGVEVGTPYIHDQKGCSQTRKGQHGNQTN